MSVPIRRAGIRCLLAKGGFAPDRLKALSERGEPTGCWTPSDVSAPLLLIVLCLCAGAEHYNKDKNDTRYCGVRAMPASRHLSRQSIGPPSCHHFVNRPAAVGTTSEYSLLFLISTLAHIRTDEAVG